MSIATQKSLLNKVRVMIAAGEARIASLDPDLRSNAKVERIAAIRAATLKDVAAFRTAMSALETVSRVALPQMNQAAARRRAQFSDDLATDAAQRLATFQTLERVSDAELLLRLRDAIDTGCIAAAECVRVEFARRSPATTDGAKEAFADLARDFNKLFEANVIDKEARDREVELKQIVGVYGVAEQLILEFESGISDPEGRISAARAAAGALDDEVQAAAEARAQRRAAELSSDHFRPEIA